MAFTAFADTVKACMMFDWNGVEVAICYHFERENYTPAQAAALADKIGERWNGTMLARMSHDLELRSSVVYDLSEEGAPKYENSSYSGNAGAIAVDSVPNNTAAVISHRTTSTGRSGRGRNYFPGVPESSCVDGVLESAYLALLAANWATHITDIEATGWDFVIAQRWEDKVQLTTGVTRPVTTEIVTEKLGTQRRRQVS